MSTLKQLYGRAERRATENTLTYAARSRPPKRSNCCNSTERVPRRRPHARGTQLGGPPGDRRRAVRAHRVDPLLRFCAERRVYRTIATGATGRHPGYTSDFLCRSAARSKLAAIAAQKEGFGKAYDLLEGFEGDKDGRTSEDVSGWYFRGLPWIGA